MGFAGGRATANAALKKKKAQQMARRAEEEEANRVNNISKEREVCCPPTVTPRKDAVTFVFAPLQRARLKMDLVAQAAEQKVACMLEACAIDCGATVQSFVPPRWQGPPRYDGWGLFCCHRDMSTCLCGLFCCPCQYSHTRSVLEHSSFLMQLSKVATSIFALCTDGIHTSRCCSAFLAYSYVVHIANVVVCALLWT